MFILKMILFSGIFGLSIVLGKQISKKYVYREKELKDMKNALNIFKSKIKFTYQPIGEVFEDISKTMKNNIGNIFKMAKEKMANRSAENAWKSAVEKSENNLTEEDKEIIKNFPKMLGQTDIEGQLSMIEVTEEFLNKQILLAEEERQKNEKLYKKLIPTISLAIIIILI